MTVAPRHVHRGRVSDVADTVCDRIALQAMNCSGVAHG